MTAPKPVMDPVLSYISFSLMSSSAEYVKKVIFDYFTCDEIVTARDVLWGCGDPSVMPKLIKQQNVRNDKGLALTITDIVDAIVTLDEAEKKPFFAVSYDLLHRIPLATCETSSIALIERMSRLEARVSMTETMLSIVKENSLPPPPPPNRSCAPPGLPHLRSQPAAKGSQSMSAAPTASDDDAAFVTVHRKRRSRNSKLITGTRTGGSFTGAPEPSRDLFLYRVATDTDENDIKKFLRDNNTDFREVEKVSHKDSKFASFRVVVKASSLPPLLSEDFWPLGVRVRRFFRKTAEDTRLKEVYSSEESSEEPNKYS
ncbi:hypothetical protein CAPTEDRAFT_187692 [Capitella teleta]|uniref:Uncharacterized protein n=1 Tax=Capitella teleta TaxID=283909 RepID=R7TKR3_CAPTE|nr:hypothetical protein CAPTEDRAFT_187692 [Capitella teleta]|eukprot:ELT94284.1 hypothetical protein CAPTEDRAFT_187692 [Capitella teleta]